MRTEILKDNPWIAYHRPPVKPWLRLFCLPYAGGSASLYRHWQNLLGNEIEVCPVQPPGRERRLSEPCMTRVDDIVRAMIQALDPAFDEPFAFFGHSLGASVAYEACRSLSAKGRPPQALVVSGRRTPGLPALVGPIYKLSDEEFRKEIFDLAGTPKEVLEHPELMELLTPMLRADFEMNDTYEPSALPPLKCPIFAYTGIDDEDVPKADIEGWGEKTQGDFHLKVIPGDHFSPIQKPEELVARIGRELTRLRDD